MNTLFTELRIPGYETKLIIYKGNQSKNSELNSFDEQVEDEMTMQLTLFDSNER